MNEAKGLKALVWVARIWSVSGIAFVLLFVFGDVFNGHGASPTKSEWIGLALWPIGVTIGLVIAWFRTGTGGIIAIVSLMAFYVWNFLERGKLPGGPYFVLVAAPGFLFILSALLSRPHQRMRPA